MSDFFIEPEEGNSMARGSKTHEPVKQPSRRKTKKEMTNEEYERVCARMAELRNRRKAGLSEPPKEKKEKPVKEVIKYVDREVIREVEKPVEKIVEKIVEKPVEVIKEVVKEVPAKNKYDLFGDTEDLKKELSEMKSMLHEMRKPKEPEKKPEVQQPVIKRMIYTGPTGMFRPY